ncbi:uncharacterized protein Z518_02291 [Rhinocladiella mackenziei CBS 650.93]|uniref:Rhinocladiella mackenziei CBS 650.93 unplaced genomic scaffold supercont1.2, whole genome shotgun sequence n=1 Tax=Rhinocladiella mackenziei CBS 650.93 TaxID=1442369 RepID=A0A0D2HB20_9EURO|nr:uncharacterized protein Z518_02291 [Rhinocladiella mackenziei CBS 650.93]KIX07638.1 hypothetical protein Z518_02291 [Rhinocladiella mackenziei CBS 650.93]
MNLSLLGDSPLAITQQAIGIFLASKQDNGQIAGISYWQTANGYTAIALHDSWSHTTGNVEILHDLLSKVEDGQKNYINEFNDDSMWWAMCMLETYNLAQDPNHLRVARSIWTHVRDYVVPPRRYIIDDNDMEGGVMWTSKPNETQLNAITAGLFSELSARLACLHEDAASRQKHLDFAIGSLSWILRCRFVPDQYLVLDHIDLDTGQKTDWTFTYNTGQAIAASIAVYDVMNQNNTDQSQSSNGRVYLDLACNMARRAMTRPGWVDDNGTLTEPDAYPGTGDGRKQAWENSDGVGFKAVLVRGLAKLYKTIQRDEADLELQTQIAKFIEWQFQSLQERDTNGQGQYGPWWDGPMDLPTSHSQLAVLDVMAAIHAVRE